MEIKKELLKREIGGESFLVPLGKTVYETNGLFVLSELGAFLWDLLPQAETAEDLVQAVLADYEVEEDVARTDILAFLDKLKTMNIL